MKEPKPVILWVHKEWKKELRVYGCLVAFKKKKEFKLVMKGEPVRIRIFSD